MRNKIDNLLNILDDVTDQVAEDVLKRLYEGKKFDAFNNGRNKINKSQAQDVIFHDGEYKTKGAKNRRPVHDWNKPTERRSKVRTKNKLLKYGIPTAVAATAAGIAIHKSRKRKQTRTEKEKKV
jgi:hypothetical protein